VNMAEMMTPAEVLVMEALLTSPCPLDCDQIQARNGSGAGTEETIVMMHEAGYITVAWALAEWRHMTWQTTEEGCTAYLYTVRPNEANLTPSPSP